MKWHEMYGLFELDWAVKSHGTSYRLDLFRVGHALHLLREHQERTVSTEDVLRIVDRVCESTWTLHVRKRYVAVIQSIRAQGRTLNVMDMCRKKVQFMRVAKEYVRGETREGYAKAAREAREGKQRDRQLELNLG